MSPIGGVGINLAIQDAVAAANILAEPLRGGAVGDDVLQQVQERREFPTRVTQRMQVFMQNSVIRSVLASQRRAQAAVAAPAAAAFPAAAPRFRRGSLGLGVRPEHIRTPERTLAEIFRLQLDRRAVRRAVGGVVPGVADSARASPRR